MRWTWASPGGAPSAIHDEPSSACPHRALPWPAFLHRLLDRSLRPNICNAIVKNRNMVRKNATRDRLGRFLTITLDRKSTRLNSSHTVISYAVFCLKKKKMNYKSCEHA